MSSSSIATAIQIFSSRLTTLEALLKTGAEQLQAEGDGFLSRRLAEDMFPLGTQVTFTCNQPHNLCRWLSGSPPQNLNANIGSLREALQRIDDTRRALATVVADDAILAAPMRLDLSQGFHADITGAQYLNDFLMPNFYFHLVTSYAILRMSGVQIGKAEYMQHLMPFVKQSA